MLARDPSVKLSALAFATAALVLPASTADAGSAACWFENGVVVVPASLMGVAGDYILDTGWPRTELNETMAQAAGYGDRALVGEARVAGINLPAQPVAVTDQDMRTGAFATPIAGIIGADLLRPYVVDVSFSPCRVALHRAGHAPGFRPARRLKILWASGRPAVTAAIADGPRALSGAFIAATGADTGVRLSDAVAAVPGVKKPGELYPYGVLRPRLRALSFAGELSENLPAGLTGAEPGDPLGVLGAPVLARYRLRFDFPRGWLLVAAPK
jgi:hypothetical protein